MEKYKLKLSLLALIVLIMMICVFASCTVLLGDDAPSGPGDGTLGGNASEDETLECKHFWHNPVVVSVPECGSKEVGIIRFTCKYCDAELNRETYPFTSHEIETVTLRELGCEVEGIYEDKCKLCGYSEKRYKSASGHNYKLCKIPNEEGACGVMCQNCKDIEKYVSVVSYEDYGAVGDGVTDDADAIRAAHEAANECGLPVLGRADATYYIGPIVETITVKTDTDWNGATFIFDDHKIRWDDSRRRAINVFTVAPDTVECYVAIPDGFSISKGQTNIGMTFDSPCMIKLESSEEKIYLRYGENANAGVNKNEIILVDADGNVDPSTPIQYDYHTLTKITRYSVGEKPISVGNGKVITIAPNPKEYCPDYENNYCYYARGINVERSNTTVYNIKHVVQGEDMTIEIDRNGDGVIDKWGADKSYGVPYMGFFSFKKCNNAVMTDCLVQGHQAYSFYQSVGTGVARNEMGSYDITANDCVNLQLLNIVQYENKETGEVITNRFMYHGVMGSNFCRNVVMDNCYVDRFDSHQGLHNAKITNSTLGFGILVIGGGELYIENCYRVSGGAFVLLRSDYNSVFDGDLIMKNCRMGETVDHIVNGTWRSFYNGLPNYVLRNITVDGLVSDSGKVYVYKFGGAVKSAVDDEVNKLYLPDSVRVSGVVDANGNSISMLPSMYNDAFSTIEIICED